MSKKVLMVVTSADKIAGNDTGLWLEEYAAPYVTFVRQGYDVIVKSIEGGQVPLDPNSLPEEENLEWQEAQAKLTNTEKLSEEDVKAGYDAVFLPGGHGTVFDFPDNLLLQSVLREHGEQDKVIGSVCHGPSAFVHVTYSDGTPLVKGKKVSAFTDAEEKDMKLESAVPFLLESTLREKGADFTSGDNWSDYSVRDGNLVTGQNPMSSQSAADKVVDAVEGR
ncbi:type 1 glutamine amidotransferase domain-containing protein [Alkalicoccus halolimnae]|jgi:putative intracellular protease/amidase|uniref:Type 1 glutamine amidotransferase domain-containing protein n=1 Tax=Alkalicoccus halolimnae TaxID=1667239 RepID=A0A5C7FNG5_9BACI|nr:type 1 glutamine amidotransferase domain-containing protein [Alkalicoccus halolimnae]TXF86866.1 type 1 glutamine amidotransferase domain-containing protein [Alkalicoccus halolimnae]